MSWQIRLVDVHKSYRVYRQRYVTLKEVVLHGRFGEWEDRWAVNGVSLEIPNGAVVGVIGANGAGKSTALKLMARILSPDRGLVEVRGRVSALLELGSGFQPEYTGRENVFLNASLLGLSARDIKRRFNDIVGFAELEDHIDEPLRTYSSGMAMRLGYAIAMQSEPDALLLDEVLAVGDESFQRKCLDHIAQFSRRGGTIVLVSHALGTIRGIATRVAWLKAGTLKQFGDPSEVIDAYLADVREEHPEPPRKGSAPDNVGHPRV
jgi:ABC-type polysaccharide/polyol phosphate transport system ATPase subunit